MGLSLDLILVPPQGHHRFLIALMPEFYQTEGLISHPTTRNSPHTVNGICVLLAIRLAEASRWGLLGTGNTLLIPTICPMSHPRHLL